MNNLVKQNSNTEIYKIPYSLVATILPIAVAFIYISLYSCNVPLWDSWAVVPLLKQVYEQKQLSFSLLLSQHNEHRLFFPRLIFVLLAKMSHWNFIYEVYFSFLLLCINFYIISGRISLLFNKNNKLIIYCLLSLSSLITFCLTQQENMLWGFQIQIFLNILMVVTGFVFLTKSEVLTKYSLIAAGICGIIATYSFANGLLFWPISCLVILIRMYNERKISYALMLAWIAIMLTTISVYFYGYKEPVGEGNSSWSLAFAHPFEYMMYVLTYIGSPIIKFRLAFYISPAIVGFLGFVLATLIFSLLAKLGILFERNILFWHALFVYSIASGLTAGLGRIGFGPEQALVSRYITLSNMFWLWIIVIGTYSLTQYRLIHHKTLFIITGFAGMIFIYYDKCVLSDAHLLYHKKMLVQVALQEDKISSEALKGYFWIKPSDVRKYNYFLKQQHLSFYYHNEKQ